MSHVLAEKIAGLASRINNLAIHHTGNSCRELLEKQDKLAKLTLLAIVNELKEEHKDYQAALKGLTEAIDFIGEADKKIQNVAKAIKLTTRAIDLIEKALKTATT